MEIWSEFNADHDTKLGSYKSLILAYQLANLTILMTQQNVCVFEEASCILHNKSPERHRSSFIPILQNFLERVTITWL